MTQLSGLFNMYWLESITLFYETNILSYSLVNPQNRHDKYWLSS